MSYPLGYALKSPGLTQPHSVIKGGKSWEEHDVGKAALQPRLSPKELKLETTPHTLFSRAVDELP